MRPPKVAFIAPCEESRTRNDAVFRVSESLVTRLTSRGAMKATFVGEAHSSGGDGRKEHLAALALRSGDRLLSSAPSFLDPQAEPGRMNLRFRWKTIHDERKEPDDEAETRSTLEDQAPKTAPRQDRHVSRLA